MDEDRTRIEAYLRWRVEATSTRVEPSEFGLAFFNDAFPAYWDGNFLRAERVAGTTAGRLIVEADRLYANFAHREIVVPLEAEGSRLAPAFAHEGWGVDRLLFMARRRDADREATDEVEESTFDEAYPLILETNLHSHEGMTKEAAEANAAVRRLFVDATGGRFFLARVEGRPAGLCELYVHGDVAEIDAVHTLERFRGRGIARAVVGRALREARRSGADLAFLIADDADWPKELYARLGFDPVGRYWQFTKRPTDRGHR